MAAADLPPLEMRSRTTSAILSPPRANSASLLSAVVLVASGVVFTSGMTTVHDLASTGYLNARDAYLTEPAR